MTKNKNFPQNQRNPSGSGSNTSSSSFPPTKSNVPQGSSFVSRAKVLMGITGTFIVIGGAAAVALPFYFASQQGNSAVTTTSGTTISTTSATTTTTTSITTSTTTTTTTTATTTTVSIATGIQNYATEIQGNGYHGVQKFRYYSASISGNTVNYAYPIAYLSGTTFSGSYTNNAWYALHAGCGNTNGIATCTAICKSYSKNYTGITTSCGSGYIGSVTTYVNPDRAVYTSADSISIPWNDYGSATTCGNPMFNCLCTL